MAECTKRGCFKLTFCAYLHDASPRNLHVLNIDVIWAVLRLIFLLGIISASLLLAALLSLCLKVSLLECFSRGISQKHWSGSTWLLGEICLPPWVRTMVPFSTWASSLLPLSSSCPEVWVGRLMPAAFQSRQDLTPAQSPWNLAGWHLLFHA